MINEPQNLSAINNPHDIWIRHFLDSAILIHHFPQNANIIDIGTGGGIPGIPLAVFRPDLHITLLDSELSKIDFCKKAVDALSLECETLAARAEDIGHDAEFRERFDFAVSRAMAQGSMLCELSLPLVKPNGALIAMKGRAFDLIAERFTSAAEALNAEQPVVLEYQLEGELKYLVTVRKSGPSPEKYPRRFAKIKRDPL